MHDGQVVRRSHSLRAAVPPLLFKAPLCMPHVLMPECCCCGRRKQDLGRFELFRWIFNEPPFGLLLDHVDSTVTSSLQV